ncbi:threonylcarbamoyl-AMP synthase [Candidatus Peregrinibacteria bacterium]|nr:threonylcarbamoyl-AMP synthase [Candidatus Peregrinibacteria bacterium]
MMVKKALIALKQGKVIAHATETCYGFACDIFNKSAISRLYKIKKMGADKPVSILVADLKMAQEFGVFNELALELAKKYWPGPLTIIVKRKKTLPKFLNPKSKTIGMRVPGHKLSLELVKKLGSPITTTSANISGLPSPYSVPAIKKQFRGQKPKPDFIPNSDRLKKTPPSTIVDVSVSPPQVIRQGTIFLQVLCDHGSD